MKTTTMNRSELLRAVNAIPASATQQGYYINSDDTDDHIAHHYSFCREHALLVAHAESILCGCGMYIAQGWSGDDSVQLCDWHGCGVSLDMGGLTDYGIDNALALTEDDPLAASVTPAELRMSAECMSDDDERWDTWLAQARRVLRRFR